MHQGMIAVAPAFRATRWEHFPHGADMGIRGRGPTPEIAFAQAALALTSVMVDLDRVQARQEIPITCRASNLDDLFFDWIDALVFVASTERMVFRWHDVHIDDGHLRAHAWGEALDPARHQPAVEVKGPTYTGLHVARDASTGLWTAQCVVDV